MARGHVERLKSGHYRAKVYAGLDPVTRRQRYLRGDVRDTESGAAKDIGGLLGQAEAQRVLNRAATIGFLLDRWMQVAELEYSTRHANQGYIERTLRPVLGDMPARKLRADTLDALYAHLRRCGKLCDGRPFVSSTGPPASTTARSCSVSSTPAAPWPPTRSGGSTPCCRQR